MNLSKFAKDPAGFLFHHIKKRRNNTFAIFSTLRLRIMLTLNNIPHGKGVSTYGRTYFNRRPLSRITLGDNVKFRSAFYSNLIGINHPCMISTLDKNAVIEIGSGCGISGAIIGAAEKIILGKDVLVGANTLITDTDWHYIHPDLRKTPGGLTKPVIIEDNVWLGINSVVLKGVHIGKNTVIGANSVVIKDIPANVIAGGNPCKVIKNLDL